MQELHILLTPDQEDKKVYKNIHAVGFRNDKVLKDNLIRTKFPNIEKAGRFDSCGKRHCLVCDFIFSSDTFFTKACGETFKIQSGTLNSNAQKIRVIFLKFRTYKEVPYFR